MAYNLLAAPAMSAECERLFSVTKWVVNNERSRTLDDLAESSQCLRSWALNDLVTLWPPLVL